VCEFNAKCYIPFLLHGVKAAYAYVHNLQAALCGLNYCYYCQAVSSSSLTQPTSVVYEILCELGV